MLKKFFLNALSAFVGAWAAITLLIVAMILFAVGLISSFATGSQMTLKSHSILKIDLQGDIDEYYKTPNVDLISLVNGYIERPTALITLTDAIKFAKNSSEIDALYLECSGASAAPATLDALRNAVLDFKQSGKKVFAYGDNLMMGDYYVATAADELYLNPSGSLNLQGISGTVLYFKDLLDKIGISFEVVKVGSFKSAVEPYISNEMSAPARLQLDTLYTEMWDYILENISESRGVKSNTVDSLVNNNIFLDEASTAVEFKLVDKCIYKRELGEILAKYTGVDKKDINFVSPEYMSAVARDFTVNEKNNIAVLYAVGDIGEFSGAGINCERMVPEIVKLAEDDNVKGLVLRVNSPGGSVFGSEQIGEALDYFKSKGKPLTVSMGDYAASGGYWISATADRIFADPLTITGSIGIFGLVPNVGGLAKKIGVHPQTVSTNKSAHFPSIFYPMTSDQYDALQKNVERGYDKFVNRVSQGRHMSVDSVKMIAEGRVWNAITAQKIGLVDDLGGLQEAINWTAEKTGMKDYGVTVFPKVEENFMNLLLDMIDQGSRTAELVNNVGTNEVTGQMLSLMRWLVSQAHEQARSIVIKLEL